MKRLIDADALREQWLCLEGNDFKASDFVYSIDEQPTVDAVPVEYLKRRPSAEPVRHGKWEMKPDPFGFFDEIPVCSECGCTTKMREKTKYCPNCGADMRGEKDG